MSDKVECLEATRELSVGGTYRHFKNQNYTVLGVCTHTETGEKLVLCRADYGDYSKYARPYDMFMAEVDHVKYPDVKQKYRFELID